MTEVVSMTHLTYTVPVTHKHRTVVMGGGRPVVVQSMTNTVTTDVDGTIEQVRALARAGSELVRLTVNTPDAARAVVAIREGLDKAGCDVPLVGDFHYNGHKLLTEVPECAMALSKYRINPGNVGKGSKAQENFATMVEVAKRLQKPVRIGVNGGSLDQSLLARMMDENLKREAPLSPEMVMREALVASALESAQAALSLGLTPHQIVLSTKVSQVPDLLAVYRALAKRSKFCLHLGLTEAGVGSQGIVASTAGLAILLNEGIGDTIRISLTPTPGAARTEEVVVAQEILQSLQLRHFTPMVTSCPGCGRTSSDFFQKLAHETQNYLREKMGEWRVQYPGVEGMKVAVMGCIVNGPGESQQADIGISLPGIGESHVAPVYIRGEKVMSLKGDTMAQDFQALIEQFVKTHYGVKAE